MPKSKEKQWLVAALATGPKTYKVSALSEKPRFAYRKQFTFAPFPVKVVQALYRLIRADLLATDLNELAQAAFDLGYKTCAEDREKDATAFL